MRQWEVNRARGNDSASVRLFRELREENAALRERVRELEEKLSAEKKEEPWWKFW